MKTYPKGNKEFGQLKYMDLSFLCSGKPVCIRGGERLPPANYSEDAGAGCFFGV